MVHSNTDFPQIIINSIPAPELLTAPDLNALLKPYVKGIKELDSYGVDFMVMVCNTIHAYHGILQAEVKTQILDLKTEMKRHLKSKGIRSALLLATPKTIESKMFEVDGLKYFIPNKEELDTISDSIYKFNSGIDREKQASKVLEIASKYIDLGAETTILGCTEISLMLGDLLTRKIDTMDILSEATINKIH